jgi:phosphoribosylglycinamide formyltransferase-1
MNLPQLGILASGSGSNFAALAEAIAQGSLSAHIAVMITNNPDAYVYQRARALGIPAVIINHREFASREVFDAQVAQTLKSYQVEWVIMAGWMRRATEVLLEAFPQRIVNIHPSLLPSFPGIKAVEQALAYGVKITGCTVHLVTLEVDQGPIVLQAAVPVLDQDTPETLHTRIQVEEHRILPEAVRILLQQNKENSLSTQKE